MGGLAFSVALLLCALVPVFAYMAEAGRREDDDE